MLWCPAEQGLGLVLRAVVLLLLQGSFESLDNLGQGGVWVDFVLRVSRELQPCLAFEELIGHAVADAT
jgi:hypothetical protein